MMAGASEQGDHCTGTFPAQEGVVAVEIGSGPGDVSVADTPAALDFGVIELPDWRDIFEGPDPAAAFWDETSECLSQFADLFDIADKDAEEYVPPPL